AAPSAVAAGAELVLEGTSLRTPYTFAINGVPLRVISLLPTRAVVRLPNNITPGTYPVAVMNAVNQVATIGPAVNVRGEGVIVTSVAASCGATDGGVDVVIAGSGFAAGATVTFDAVPATNIVVLDATKIQARVPANYAGAATIAVTNTDGTVSTLTNGFRYVSPFDPAGCGTGRTRAVRH
ncbi:MAG TPA: IPT/TIG domain-containing protein, partial [Thermoanaerobaculia bacterium]